MGIAEQHLSHHLASTLLVLETDQQLMERKSFTEAILPNLDDLPDYCRLYAYAVIFECNRRNLAFAEC